MCRWHLSFFSFLPSSSFSVHYFAFATLLYIAARRIRKTSPKRQDKSSFSSAAVRTEERMSDTIRVPNLYGGSTIHLPVLSVRVCGQSSQGSSSGDDTRPQVRIALQCIAHFKGKEKFFNWSRLIHHLRYRFSHLKKNNYTHFFQFTLSYTQSVISFAFR